MTQPKRVIEHLEAMGADVSEGTLRRWIRQGIVDDITEEAWLNTVCQAYIAEKLIQKPLFTDFPTVRVKNTITGEQMFIDLPKRNVTGEDIILARKTIDTGFNPQNVRLSGKKPEDDLFNLTVILRWLELHQKALKEFDEALDREVAKQRATKEAMKRNMLNKLEEILG
jgi:hypothetical protein